MRGLNMTESFIRQSIKLLLILSHVSFLLVSVLHYPTFLNLLLSVDCTQSASVLTVHSYSTQINPQQSILRRQTLPSNSSSEDLSLDQSPAADGTDSSRSAASSLLFSFTTVLLGLLLLLGGRILPRISSSIGFAIATSFPVWALCVNLAGEGGLTGRSSSQAAQNLAIWGLVTGTLLFGFAIGFSLGQNVHRIGVYLLSIHSGFALGVSILIFSHQLTIHYASIRWVFLALLASIFTLLVAIFPPSIGTCVVCATSGSFLLFLGIDLLTRANSGMSLGIRFLFDHNHHHAKDLLQYHPSTSTRVLLTVSWVCMLLGAVYQYKLLARPLNITWPPDFYRNSKSFLSQSTILIDENPESNAAGKEVNRLSIMSSSSHSQEKSTEIEGPSFLASPQPQEFESPSESEQRNTTDSFDTGLSAIPELTEQSSSGRGGSRSGSGSGRGGTGMLASTHRHPSNSTYNSIRRSTLSSEHQAAVTVPPSLSGVADPSSIPVSPPLTVLTETTVFPEDSVSQAARQRLGITFYNHSRLIEEETEVMATPIRSEMSHLLEQDGSQDGTHRVITMSDHHQQLSNTPLLLHANSLSSTGLLTRLGRVFGDESYSVDRLSAQLTHQDHNCTEEAGEEQALQSDAERWAQLKDGQLPYGHAAGLRRDLHSWSDEEPT